MTIQTPIKNLKQHPAQMRTVYDIESLATLCLQIYERGLDEWQPLLAAPNGEEGTYFIVSGHRRQMARLLAWALADWAADHPDKEIGIEVAHTMIVALVESLGSLPNVISALLEKYGDQEIPVVLFAGSQKAEILSLQAANYGSKRNAFEFLTGRPLSANEAHGDWFARQLEEQIGELSDAQMFTLFVWAHAEWQRARNGRLFSLPLNGNGVQFADYNETHWTMQEAT